MDKTKRKAVRRLLKYAASISMAELPAAAIGALAFLPGFVDEAIVGVGALAVFAAIALGRHYLVGHRQAYLDAIKAAYDKNEIDEAEFQKSMYRLNTLTIEGGAKKS